MTRHLLSVRRCALVVILGVALHCLVSEAGTGSQRLLLSVRSFGVELAPPLSDLLSSTVG